MGILVVTCTFPEHEIAWRISRDSVEKGLAACATLIPEAKSIYRWKGQIETANETVVFFKTTEDRFEALRNFVLKDHPYEVPEFLAWPVAKGSAEYYAWVDASTRVNK
jgi:periplasmic divalent cation tolerance protein